MTAASRFPVFMLATTSFCIMREATASGIAPSTPYPVSMRAFLAPVEITSSMPLSLSALPSPHCLKSSVEYSSIDMSPISGTTATAISAEVPCRNPWSRRFTSAFVSGESILAGSATKLRASAMLGFFGKSCAAAGFRHKASRMKRIIVFVFISLMVFIQPEGYVR